MCRRAFAWVVIVALVAAHGLPALSARHLFADSDVECGPGLINGHPVSQFEAARSPLADEHCAVCHFARAVNGARPGALLTAVITDDLSDAIGGVAPSHYTLDLDVDTPSRAPPVRS